jgi:adenylate cyclase
LIMLDRSAEGIGWLESALRVVAKLPPSQLREREPWDSVAEQVKVNLAAAYALTGQIDDAHRMLASALTSERTMDFTIRYFKNAIPIYYDAQQQQQELRVIEGLHLAGLRDQLDEDADFGVAPTPDLRENTESPTPVRVPGATTIRTEEMVRLLERRPLILTTAISNPSIPGAILTGLGLGGSLSDEWQTALGKLVGQATQGNKQRAIVVFSYSINRWHSYNLALRLVALGYTNVYWYRGGWEAWDAHDLPKAPLDVQMRPVY